MKTINILFLISLVILAGAAALSYVKLSPSNELILHFAPSGEPDATGVRADVFGALALGAVILLFNYILTVILDRRERFFARILAIVGPALALLLFVAVSVIVVNNQ